MKMKIAALVFVLCFCSGINGSERYGDKCERFQKDELKPGLFRNQDRYCLKKGTSEYCKTFTCPPADCDDPHTPEDGRCLYCEGTCSYGGSVYPRGGGFKIRCLDGTNRCMCLRNNRVASSRMSVNLGRMCNSDY